jgi:hypothetical protein
MPLNNAAVADYWDAMAKAPADPLIQQLNAQRRTMRLNDWGYLELLRKTAERIYPQSENSRTLFVWTFLQQNGYRAKVGYVNDRMFLLIASRQILYGRPYFSFGDDGTRYYVLSLTGGREKPPASMYTYKGENAAAVNPFDLSLADAPRIRSLVASKSLTFEHHGAKQRVDVRWDASAVRFLQSYPETEFSVYYDASPSPEAASSLTDALRPIIRGKSQPEALDLLLHFVQTAFEYKTDEEQFGYQKVFTPDEILSYPYSACADRSVLFAYLVRALLNVPVVGLVYPNHMCTAVLDRAGLPGDHVRVGNASYIICDPTYINADHGMCMPQFKGVTPTVVMMKGPEGN